MASFTTASNQRGEVKWRGQYRINTPVPLWHLRTELAGGGGTSTGGVYAVTGTIGQPDAGTMSGGTYTLSGGFWGAIAAVQTPGAPYLWASLTPTNTALIWWAVSPTSWRLQATTNLVPMGSVWTDCSYQTNGATCYRLESPPSSNRFYRLQSP